MRRHDDELMRDFDFADGDPLHRAIHARACQRRADDRDRDDDEGSSLSVHYNPAATSVRIVATPVTVTLLASGVPPGTR